MHKLFFVFAAFALLGCSAQSGQPTATPLPSVALASPTPTFMPSVAVPSPTPSAVATASPSPSPSKPSNLTELKFTFTLDDGVRVNEGSVPFAFKLPDGRVRLYYCGLGGILSSVSTDGLNFQAEAGVRVQGPSGWAACDPSVIDLGGGKVRMYYKIAQGQGGPGQAVHKVASAISSDGGLTFQDEGVRIDSQANGDNGWASVPDALKLSDGRVRIYYVSGDPQARGGIGSAVSEDGLAFTKEDGARLPSFVDPAIIQLSSGMYVLFAVLLPNHPDDPNFPDFNPGIYLFGSVDGMTFSKPLQVLAGGSKGVFDPSVLEVDNKTLRIYFGGNVGSSATQPQVVVQSITGKIS